MAVFPKLKTGAAAQYPLVVGETYETHVARFLDLSEQRFRRRGAASRSWIVDLRVLTQRELDEIERFFEEQRGAFAPFDFEDPVSGAIVQQCRFDQDVLPLDEHGEFDASASIVILEDQ